MKLKHHYALVACRSEVVTGEGAFHNFISMGDTAHGYRASLVSTNVVSATRPLDILEESQNSLSEPSSDHA
jgi:hypothetical protein